MIKLSKLCEERIFMASFMSGKSKKGNKAAKKVRPKAKPIKLRVPRTHKPDGIEVEEWQRLLRRQYAEMLSFKIKNTGDHPIFSEFAVTNPASGKTYKIAIRGLQPGDNYCSCPDFSINTLGTCKHIEFVLSRLQKKSRAKGAFSQKYDLPYSEVYLSYGLRRQIRFRAGSEIPDGVMPLIREYFDENGVLKDAHLTDFNAFFDKLPKDSGHGVRCYDDVMGFIAEHQDAAHRRDIVNLRLKDGANSPILESIIKTRLYPYQREGAFFAVKAGRCLLGDDMGLGKTIQALAAAELMAKLYSIKKVLIICPTSLKYQWKTEIEKFTSRSATVMEGMTAQRRLLYKDDSFFRVLNYELIHKDIKLINESAPDLIILDEAQRIKNWKTRTAQSVKKLESPFAFVLTGTPIENRIEELHSIMEFVDRFHLGPLYRFVHDHRITDSGGKVIGYQDLQSVRESLKDVLLRRRKSEVLKQLPARTDKNFMVPMTPEQREIHEEFYEIVVKLVAKWRKYRFLSDADQKRLQMALNCMRMSADNTYLVDKKTVHGPKIEELEILLKELIVENNQKAVIFSQWLRMNELVEHILKRNNIGYVHLNGSVPSKQRQGLMKKFKEDPDCKVFLSTDAGGVGLNLQSGSVVINMDIPWNPAVLEQRIGRVHRLGQQRNVSVINFVSAASIEERILELLKFKKSLFAGALDADGENVVMVGESQLKRFMQSVETVVEDIKKPDPVYEAELQKEAADDKKTAEAVSPVEEEQAGSTVTDNGHVAAFSELLAGGAKFLTDLSRTLSESGKTPGEHIKGLLSQDEATGKPFLRIPLPDKGMVQNIVSILGKFLEGLR
jgi:superfamily II DNA or RNA helicase